MPPPKASALKQNAPPNAVNESTSSAVVDDSRTDVVNKPSEVAGGGVTEVALTDPEESSEERNVRTATQRKRGDKAAGAPSSLD